MVSLVQCTVVPTPTVTGLGKNSVSVMLTGCIPTLGGQVGVAVAPLIGVSVEVAVLVGIGVLVGSEVSVGVGVSVPPAGQPSRTVIVPVMTVGWKLQW